MRDKNLNHVEWDVRQGFKRNVAKLGWINIRITTTWSRGPCSARSGSFERLASWRVKTGTLTEPSVLSPLEDDSPAFLDFDRRLEIELLIRIV